MIEKKMDEFCEQTGPNDYRQFLGWISSVVDKQRLRCQSPALFLAACREQGIVISDDEQFLSLYWYDDSASTKQQQKWKRREVKLLPIKRRIGEEYMLCASQ